jgi:hypothetical protein
LATTSRPTDFGSAPGGELSFEARGGHLELVSNLQRGLVVEKAGHPAGQLGKPVDTDAVAVDGDAQNSALTDR